MLTITATLNEDVGANSIDRINGIDSARVKIIA
jgi:hypothetical protein